MQSTFSKPGTGAPASASPDTASTPEPQAQETKPLTIEQVREEATRIAQSFVDKAERRISASAQAQIETLKQVQSATGLTDEQFEQAKQKIVMNDLTQPAAPASAAQTAQPSQVADDTDPVIAEIMQTFQEEGVEIVKGDPEFEAINSILIDPNSAKNPAKAMVKLRKALFTGIESKRQRVAASTETAAARVLGGGAQTTGEASPESAHDKWSVAYKKE